MRKLSNRDVNAIKLLYESGVGVCQLARAFNVDESSIRYRTNPTCTASKKGRYLKRLVNRTPDSKVVDVISNYVNRG